MSGVLALVTEPFQFDFMRRALAATLAVGVVAPVCGCWAVPRRLVYLSDAMSHAILAGVAGAALLSASLLVGGVTAALVMATLVSLLVVRARVPADGAVGVTGQGLFATGVLLAAAGDDPRSLSHVLFGNPLTVTTADVVSQWVMVVVVLAGAWLLAPALTATTVDLAHARGIGMRTATTETALVVGLALVVVVGLTTVGVLMAVTLVVAPAVAARLVGRRMSTIIPIASALGVTAGVTGLLVSYHLGVSTGPVIALVAVAEVALAAVVAAARERGGAPRSLGAPAPVRVPAAP